MNVFTPQLQLEKVKQDHQDLWTKWEASQASNDVKEQRSWLKSVQESENKWHESERKKKDELDKLEEEIFDEQHMMTTMLAQVTSAAIVFTSIWPFANIGVAALNIVNAQIPKMFHDRKQKAQKAIVNKYPKEHPELPNRPDKHTQQFHPVPDLTIAGGLIGYAVFFPNNILGKDTNLYSVEATIDCLSKTRTNDTHFR